MLAWGVDVNMDMGMGVAVGAGWRVGVVYIHAFVHAAMGIRR